MASFDPSIADIISLHANFDEVDPVARDRVINSINLWASTETGQAQIATMREQGRPPLQIAYLSEDDVAQHSVTMGYAPASDIIVISPESFVDGPRAGSMESEFPILHYEPLPPDNAEANIYIATTFAHEVGHRSRQEEMLEQGIGAIPRSEYGFEDYQNLIVEEERAISESEKSIRYELDITERVLFDESGNMVLDPSGNPVITYGPNSMQSVRDIADGMYGEPAEALADPELVEGVCSEAVIRPEVSMYQMSVQGVHQDAQGETYVDPSFTPERFGEAVSAEIAAVRATMMGLAAEHGVDLSGTSCDVVAAPVTGVVATPDASMGR